jgi:hypothetical protein
MSSPRYSRKARTFERALISQGSPGAINNNSLNLAALHSSQVLLFCAVTHHEKPRARRCGTPVRQSGKSNEEAGLLRRPGFIGDSGDFRHDTCDPSEGGFG